MDFETDIYHVKLPREARGALWFKAPLLLSKPNSIVAN